MEQGTAGGILAGKRALITGAAGGIGRAAAHVFAREGALVALVDVDERSARRLAQALAADFSRSGDEFPALRGEVTDAADVDRYMTAAADAMGGLDVLFNNAGVEGLVAPIQDYDDAAFDRVMRINVRGVWLNLKRAVSFMVEQGGRGSIVNTSSGAGLRGLPLLSAYVASKHAVLGITRSAAVELAETGIRVNAVCPGPIETRMMASLEEQKGRVSGADAAEARSGYAAPIPMRRYGTAAEVAETVAFLASDAASYITGAAVAVDGGGSAA
jgi:3alpha(or 20beta)-hydroxysteroid dehydrogenase